MQFHALFATRFGTFITRPEQVQFPAWLAFYHHFVDHKMFSHYWLTYRVAYIEFKGSIEGIVVITLLMLYQLVAYGACWHFFMDLQLMILIRHIQGLTHEYYHVPISKR